MTQLPAPPRHPTSVAYLGSPVTAVGPLRVLVDAGVQVDIVVSAPDKRRGRGGKLQPTPVKEAALDLDLSVTDDIKALSGSGVDLGVVVAFGRLIRLPLLEAIPFVNLHYSLLPRWRGAAPVERAILAGDARAGVCVMAVEEALDEGGVYRSAATEVDHKTAEELRAELSDIGAALLLEALADGFGPAAPQLGEITYAAKVDPAEREIQWDESSTQIDRLVRVGGAWTTFRGKRLKVVAATVVNDPVDSTTPPGSFVDETVMCGPGSQLTIDVVQPEGKVPMNASAWRNGAQLAPDDRLGGT